MPTLISEPTIIQAASAPAKKNEEFIGRVNSSTKELSIARMTSEQGWTKPGQTPEFNEYTLVLEGSLRVETHAGTYDVRAGQVIHCKAGEWIRYSTPNAGGACYVAVCAPAFSPATVHRDVGDVE